MGEKKTFWDHVEVFRWMLIRVVIVLVVTAVVAFCFKDFVFTEIILAPCRCDFATYSLLVQLASKYNVSDLFPQFQDITLINIDLSAQLFVHISISFYIALIVAFPYLMIELWLFTSPALYHQERKPAVRGVVTFTLLFFMGVFLSYYLIFPLTLNFLGSYQVSESVTNQISLRSYINNFLSLIFVMGIVFEMPVVAYFFAKIGVLTSSFLSRYRKISIVIVLASAALITPSTDVFTMMLVALPLQLLYELSRCVVKWVERKRSRE